MRRGLPLHCPTFTSRPPPPTRPGPAAPSTSYGPFSAAARARVSRERQQQQQQGTCPATAVASASGAENVDVMANIGLGTNLPLRLSLAGLPHPSQQRNMKYQSEEWRLAMVRLYRTILRLHNKTVAVSVDRSRTAGAAEAVAAVTGVGSIRRRGVSAAEERFLREGDKERGTRSSDRLSNGSSSVSSGCPEGAEPKTAEDYLLKYLLTPEQREFGNRFVQGEFTRNRDADALSGIVFYESWYQYILQLASGVTAKDMTEEEKRLLTPDQKEKLKELRNSFVSFKAQNEPGYML